MSATGEPFVAIARRNVTQVATFILYAPGQDVGWVSNV